MKISDEIRDWCDFYSGESINNDDCDKLRAFADRIDSEMVELPRDRDGVRIHVGDMMWDYMTGRKMTVTTLSTLSMRDSGWYVFTDKAGYVKASHLTHAQPDSLESIASGLEDMVDDMLGQDTVTIDMLGGLRDFADRIRRLADKEGK